jgi:uncharacterized membrane protein YhiD involved in acid resistance
VRRRRHAVRISTVSGVLLLAAIAVAGRPATAQTPGPAAEQPVIADAPASLLGRPEQGEFLEPLFELRAAMVRLPLAAALGTALALRPRRRGTPRRDPAVVQTQIVLAVVGAVIMLVIGASLARAFGIVGAANLIRYRSKIEDPKDAVVMLCALAVGLASGVGLYALAIFSTAFLVLALGVIESFEKGVSRFDLRIRAGKEKDTDAMRPKFEAILRRFRLAHELRTSSDEEVCYDVQVPLATRTDRISDALLRLDPEGSLSVEWTDKKGRPR